MNGYLDDELAVGTIDPFFADKKRSASTAPRAS
jgi:hypothetical protein